MSESLAPQRVYVELDWYDGPRSGVADYLRTPHRFQSTFDELEGYEDTFRLWPIDTESLTMEIEQWQIYVAWNLRYEAGELGSDSHPEHGGNSSRYDFLKSRLEEQRRSVPKDAKLAKVEFIPLDDQPRYADSGPAYQVCWLLL